MCKLLIYRLAVWGVGAFCFSAALAADPALPPVLQAQVKAILQSSNSAGAAIILVDALGVSAAHLHGDVRARTCQSTGAAGDSLVALAAMRLAERDKVDLYASLPSSLSDSLRMPISTVCKSKVTLSHLLEHTSGLGGLSGQSNACSGSSTAYSASGIQLAELALEKITQTSMNSLMKREVFVPLAMHSSSWNLGTSASPVASSVDSSCSSVSAPAQLGLTTTPHDMANMVQMLLLRGQVDAKTYLPQCAVERMGISVSAASMPGGNSAAAINRAEYGLGLQRFKAGGQSWLGYSGDLQGSRWVWAYSSQSQSAMVIMLSHRDAKTLKALKIAVANYLQKDAAKVVASSR